MQLVYVGRGWGGASRSMWNCANYGNITSIEGGTGGLMANGDSTKLYNCYNTGNLTRTPWGLGGDNFTPSAVNCYSAGILSTTSTASRVGVLLKNGATLTNCYYLNGIQGTTNITPEAGAIKFYKTSTDEEAMTSEKVVKALNDYIDAHLNDEDTATNTSDWLRWRVGENGLPELIFEEIDN